MPREKLFRTPHHPYHVYNRVICNDFYPEAHKAKIWEIYCDMVCYVTWAYGARVHALVLMTNHYHMIISTPYENLDQIMMYFQREISKRIVSLETNERYRFQSRYHWVVVKDPRHYRDLYKYVFTNPEDINPHKECTQYPFSTLTAQCGNRRLLCPIYENEEFGVLIPQLIADREVWINSH
jgi:putative transposase